MKAFIVLLKIVVVLFLNELEMVESQNNALWLEIGNELFFVEPEGRHTWKQAVAACKKEHSNLISVKGDYDYAKLKNVIKHNFKNYSSFWTSAQVKSFNIFHSLGLGKEEHDRKKCYKFDNVTAFKFLPEECHSRLGFICQKPLINLNTSFKTKTMVYFVEPQQAFSCEQAYEQCKKRQMFLTIRKDYASNKSLKDYVFFNYGSALHFWFGFTNETHNNCETVTKNPSVKANSKLGFICERVRAERRLMTDRHIILLVFVGITTFLALSMFIIIKCFCHRKEDSFDVPEADFRKEIRVSDIK